MSFTWWRYRSRRFEAAGEAFVLRAVGQGNDFVTRLYQGGRLVDEDRTPSLGPDAVRNHRLQAFLADGRRIEVEAGYVSLFSIGIRVAVEGALVHESHPGRAIAYPEKYRDAVVRSGGTYGGLMKAAGRDGHDPGVDYGVWKRNRVPLLVDIAMGLIFFVLTKATDLTTAALVSAALGIGLILVQRFVRVDLIGGLALFGVVMALLSAGLALAFQDDMAIKMRGTILGLVSATLFLGDGLLGGNRLGRGLARYVPYSDLDPGRLALGMGLLGLVMAGLNYIVAKLASTDLWLFYTTFVDFVLVMAMVLLVFRYARRKPPFVGGDELAAS